MTVRITAIRKSEYRDLMEEYENPIGDACNIEVGQVFTVQAPVKPEGLCDSAWETILPFIEKLLAGGGNFYGGWMKNKKSAMVSCNDGFRPVSFYIELIEE